MKLIRYTHTTVTQEDWCASITTGSGIEGAILSVRRFRIAGRGPKGKPSRGGTEQLPIA
jgi:hypothetical protein